MSNHPETVYRICPADSWRAAVDAGAYAGEALDKRDGYLHLSMASQLAGTLATHFDGRADLVVVEVSVALLGDALRWEASRGGALFPHLYARLLPEQASAVYELRLDEEGVHRLPDLL